MRAAQLSPNQVAFSNRHGFAPLDFLDIGHCMGDIAEELHSKQRLSVEILIRSNP
jgi:hypothetical protein